MEIKINIPYDVKYIIQTLKNNGYKAFIVGGCVRDSILNRKPKDWDITTNAKPETIIQIFNKTIPTGLQHGTVTVMINKEGYEVTTFRTDGEYEDSRHPNKVNFVDDIELDLSRRDFTMNAMAYNDESGLIDPYNGLEDLNNKIVRCVGKAKDRFNEDALRMMRAIRFAAQLGFRIHESINLAISEMYFKLNNISIERIREEFNKILLSNIDCLDESASLYLTGEFLSILNNMRNFNQNNPYHHLDLFNHTLQSVKLIEDRLYLKLTMLFHDIGKLDTRTEDEQGISHYYRHAEISSEIALSILKRMKYDNETIDKVLTLIKYHDCTIESKTSIKRLLNKLGEELLRDLIKVKWADILAQNPIYAKERLVKLMNVERVLDEIVKQQECFSIKDLAINGKDLINLGYKQGKEIGMTLNKLLQIVLEDNELNNKEALISLVKGLG